MQAQMSIVREIIYASVARGADFLELCKGVGVTPQALTDTEHASFEEAAIVWNVALKQTGDPLLGLHIGEKMNPSIVGMTGYLMQHSATMEEALMLLCKFNDLYSTMMKFSFHRDGKSGAVSFEPAFLWLEKYPESVRQSVEYAMSGIVSIFLMMTGNRPAVEKIELAFPVRDRAAYDALFQCPVHFKAKQNAIYFDQTLLATKINTRDKTLFAFFNETLQRKLNAIKSQSRISERIRHLVLTRFKGVVPPIGIAASALQLSTRSMQRKLKEEDNMSYRGLGMSIKKEFSLSMMSNADVRIKDVAYLLGYSDSSAFKKAYNKWTSTPKQK